MPLELEHETKLTCYSLPSTTPTYGHFVLSPVSLASRDQAAGWRPDELNDQRGGIYDVTEKIGYCEESRFLGLPQAFSG